MLWKRTAMALLESVSFVKISHFTEVGWDQKFIYSAVQIKQAIRSPSVLLFETAEDVFTDRL